MELAAALVAALFGSAMGLGMARSARTRWPAVERHEARGKLVDELTRDPGLRVYELCKRLGLNRGTARYHLYILERAGVIGRVPGAGAQHYFGPGPGSDDMERLMVLRRERAPEIVAAVVAEPGVGQQELLARIRMHRTVFRSYASDLVGAGLLAEQRHGRTRTYHPTPRLLALLDRWAREPAGGGQP